MNNLRIGKISFLNILPIFRQLEGECYCPDYEFVEGYPTELNRMLRFGEIHVSPSSSVEYLRDTETYSFIEGHSISARGPVRSILLFSTVPIEELGRHEIMATHKSATSVSLLEVILRKFYCIEPLLRVTDTPIEDAVRAHSAYLAIGDEALGLSRAALDIRTTSEDVPHKLQSLLGKTFYVYDLSDLWFRHTGLPMVFALWIFKKETLQSMRHEVAGFKAALDKARDRALENLWDIADTPGLMLPPEEAYEYWKNIIFGLPDDCLQGLELFGKYLHELRG